MGEFDGKVAVITGAGRMRGIGHATAIALASRGADVVITGTGRNPSTFPPDEQAIGWRDVDSVAEEITAMDRRALPLIVDVSNGTQVQGMVDRAVETLGRIDFLVNNAGSGRTVGLMPLAELPEEAWRRVIDVKLTGTFLCTRAALQVLLRQGQGGSIVNVATVEAKLTPVNNTAYASASAALYTLTAVVAKEVAPRGIRVNCVSPGTTDTASNDGLYDYPRTERWTERIKAIPLGRAGRPEELGRFIAWLCSKEAEFIVGESIHMDGGQRA